MNVDDITGLIAVVAVFMIPLVAILVRHQQKMAQILHGASNPQPAALDVANLREEVQLLRQQMTQLALTVDDLKQAAVKPDLRERIAEVKSQPGI